jgi:CheY-like chemotaxis protein
MQMPETDGITLASEIRRFEDERGKPGHRLPLVMLTSLGRRDPEADGVGLAAYLSKPIKASQLFNVLVSIFAGQPVLVQPRDRRGVQFDSKMAERHPLHILLAEDNTINQKLALNMLQRLGYRADVAGNGAEVLQAVARQHYDVVLMDVQMPVMDGMEATRQLTSIYGASRPRVIALTANALVEDRDMCLRAGMDDYISKPIRVEELIDVLSRTPPSILDLHTRPPQESSDQTVHAHRPASPFPNDQAATLDTAVLERLRDAMDAGFVAELIGDFIGHAPDLLASMRQAVERDKPDELRLAAHTLKSNSASLGALRLAELCRRLEETGRDGGVNGSTLADLELAEAEFVSVRPELETARVELSNA